MIERTRGCGLLVLVGCLAPVETGDTGEGGGMAPGLPSVEPIAVVDVLVIGSGAGGMAAAWAAREAGASVLLVERSSTPGGASINASNYWAAGTRWQTNAGVSDSAALAIAEWESFTGGDAGATAVQEFVEGSAGVLDWLESLGSAFNLVSAVGADTGSARRTHALATNGAPSPMKVLGDSLAAELRLDTTVTELVLNGADVAGAWITPTEGEAGWVQAGTVVVATGGFTRNDALVFEAVPELASHATWVEAFPGMDGNGLEFTWAAGAASQNLERLGLYAHGVEDAKLGQPEVMVVVGLDSALVVDAAGNRVTDERSFGSVAMGTRYLTEGPFYAIADDVLWSVLQVQGRGFNYIGDPDGILLTAAEYESSHGVALGEDAEALGRALGIDPAGLAASLAAYNADAELGLDSQFGKPAPEFGPLTEGPWRGLPLVLGRSKSFGGLATNDVGAVLTQDGRSIRGLYAAGEVCGFLGDPGVGSGINGSITMAFWSGLRAGEAAAVGQR